MEFITLRHAIGDYPEQYTAVDCDGNIVAFLCCNGGVFEVTLFDGEEIYSSSINGGDYFAADERDTQLRAAKWAIANYYVGERV